MKRLLIMLMLAAIMLSGCGRDGGGGDMILPKITYADEPAVTAPPTPTPVVRETADWGDFTSQISELYIMDEGYSANAVASIGGTLLAADLNEPDYQLVLADYRLTDEGGVELTDRKILMSGGGNEVYESCLYGISASPDGYYYVLSGEPLRKAQKINAEGGVSIVSENPNYSGKYRVLKYSAEGERIAACDIPCLPTGEPWVFTADAGERVYIFGAISRPDSAEKYDVVDLFTASLLDFSTGSCETVDLGMMFVASACPWDGGLLVYAEKFLGAPLDYGFFRFDMEDGSFNRLDWPYTYGGEASAHMPFCFLCNGKIYVNNREYYGSFEPNSLEFEPLLNAVPDGYSALPEPPDYKDYPQFSTCCCLGEQIFVGTAAIGSGPLYVVSPA